MTQEVTIDYTNWKGVRRLRNIRPIGLYFCANEWHPKAQWMIEAVDLEYGDVQPVKFFPLASVHSWTPTMPVFSGSIVGGPK